MNQIKDIIALVNAKNIDTLTPIKLKSLIEEIHTNIKEKYEEIPYYLVADVISRMTNISISINKEISSEQFNFRQWDKILKIDEININKNNVIIKIPKKSQSIEDHFMELFEMPQPEQRTKEWFDYRYNRITASDMATAIDMNPYESVEAFICKKCDPNFPFLDNDFVFHGKKYEQIATSLYEHIYNSKVTEFGCVPSEKHLFLGASPDGISSKSTLDYKFNPKLGYMLEIKCPFVREIKNKGAIAGDICPFYYYCQVQQQLECCELEYCDFIQCNLTEYKNREEYLRDVGHTFDISEGVEGTPVKNLDNSMSKGYLLQFLPKVFEPKFDGDKHHYKSFYIYPPRLNMSEAQYQDWVLSTLSTWQTDYPDIADTFFFDRILYWKIKNAHTVTIPRDRDWFNHIFPILKETWAKVTYYREHLEELPMVQEMADKRKKFYRYKTDITMNNFEPNSKFLEDSKTTKKTSNTYKSTYKPSNNKSKFTKSKPLAPASNDCDFVDD